MSLEVVTRDQIKDVKSLPSVQLSKLKEQIEGMEMTLLEVELCRHPNSRTKVL